MKYYDKLIFELSKEGRTGYSLPDNKYPAGAKLPAGVSRESALELPQVSEPDVVRHYTNLSQMNFGVDTGFYPLGSCTMKYNPKINEEVAAMPGFAGLHPLMEDSLVPGARKVYEQINKALAEITGLHTFTLDPCAGAHGELTGLMIKTEDTNIAPNIYLEGYFEQYQDGKDIEDIVRDIADVRVKHEMSQDFDVSKLTDFDQVKDHIICKLVNGEMNKDYLADKPFTTVEDLAVIYAVDLGGNNDGHMTAPITNRLMESYV